jgi:hypothetical protein
MRALEELDGRVLAIVHFVEEEGRPMSRLVHYQCVLDMDLLSPSGEYIRCDHSRHTEINGWVKVESIVIDEILDREFTKEKEAEQLKAA